MDGELCRSVVGAQRVDSVVEEFDAVGVVGCEREDVDDAAAHCILAGFHDEVLTFEAPLGELVGEIPYVHLLSFGDMYRIFGQDALCRHLFGERFGVADDDEWYA